MKDTSSRNRPLRRRLALALAALSAAGGAALPGVAGADTLPMNWAGLPGALTRIAQGANGSLWGLGTNLASNGGGYQLYVWSASQRNWVGTTGSGIELTVDPSGNPWVISLNHNVWHWTGSYWAEMPWTAVKIAAALDGSIWFLGLHQVPGGSAIYRYAGGQVQAYSGGATQITVDSDSIPWVVNNQNMIFTLNSSGWFQPSPSDRAVAISAGPQGCIWILGTIPVPGGFAPYEYDWFSGRFTSFSGGLTTLGASQLNEGSTCVLYGANNTNVPFVGSATYLGVAH